MDQGGRTRLRAGDDPAENLILELGSGSTLAAAGLSVAGAAGAVIIFTLVASLAVLVPLVVVLALGDRTAAPLATAREWLLANNTAIMLVMFLYLAATFIGDGLRLTS